MRTSRILFLVFLCAFAVIGMAQTQPNFVARVNGTGTNAVLTNTTLKSTTTMKNAAETGTFTITPSFEGVNSRLTITGTTPLVSPVTIEDAVINARKFIGEAHPAFTGDGGGLTNLAAATNFSETVVYNFNGKVTFNAVSYNTNLWAGPTNTLILSTNYQDYITTTDVNITNVGGQLARQNTWATLTVSNASASDITVRSTASGLRAQGPNTSAAMVVGAGKEGILSFLSRDFKSTNYVTTAQQ